MIEMNRRRVHALLRIVLIGILVLSLGAVTLGEDSEPSGSSTQPTVAQANASNATEEVSQDESEQLQLFVAVIALNLDETSPLVKRILTDDGMLREDWAISSYEWDLDGDGIYETETVTPFLLLKGLEEAGPSVRLFITDSKGNVACIEQPTWSTGNWLPECWFIRPSSPITDADAVLFTGEGEDLDGWISAWRWDFGDGATSALQPVLHTFPDDGTYEVCLSVQDDKGAESRAYCSTINVENALPVAAFEVSKSPVRVGEPVSFVNVSWDPSPTGHIVHVGWDFGDGVTWSGSPGNSEFSHTYEEAGTYTVTLSVIDDDGGLSVSKKKVSIFK